MKTIIASLVLTLASTIALAVDCPPPTQPECSVAVDECGDTHVKAATRKCARSLADWCDTILPPQETRGQWLIGGGFHIVGRAKVGVSWQHDKRDPYLYL